MLLRRKPGAAEAAVAGIAPDVAAASAARTTPNFVLAAYERYSRVFYGYIYRIVASAPDAEDILQETFARALVSCHTRPGGDDSEALTYCRRWLYQVATNLSVDLLRRRKRHPYPLNPSGEGGDETDSDQGWSIGHEGTILHLHGGVWQSVACSGLG